MNRRVSTHEPISQLRRIEIRECGEPLVDFLQMSPRLVFAQPRWRYTRVHLLRKTVAEGLCRAAESLPSGFRLAVVEGWRPPHIQRRMYEASLARWRERHPDWPESVLKRVTNRFTAPPNVKVPPPHSTGGALDVILADEDGVELDMSAPFAPREPRAYPFDATGISPESRHMRKIMREALQDAGITNYPSEFWHYSFGDQGWAYREGREFAVYGATQPDGYVPPPEDDTHEPLERVR